MALIKCIECGKQFSDKAKACPSCGCPTSAMTGQKDEMRVSISLPIHGPSSEDATKKMKAAVAEAKSTASSADREFDWENSKIQRKASSSIDLFGGSAVSQVADISMMAKKACDDLYAALQMALITLDATCRPLLAANPDGTAIRDVYYEIKQLNSDSEISNTFTASLNYNNLGDVATRRYSPSLEAKMIENFWRSEYDKIKKDMDRIESERRAKEEAQKRQAAEEKRRKVEAFQAANRDKIDEYDAKNRKSVSILSNLEKEAFEKKTAEIKKNRETEKSKVESSASKKADEAIKAIKEEQSTLDQEYVNSITMLRTQLDEKKSAIEGLGLFKGAKKKELYGEIESLVNNLQAATEGYKEKAGKFEGQIKKHQDEKTSTIKKEYDAIDARFPLPEMVKKKETAPAKVSPVMQPSAVQIANEAIKDAIYEYLLGVDLVTVVDIQNDCPEACDLTNQRVSALVRQLVTEGKVERVEEKRKAFFRAVEGYSTTKKKTSTAKNSDPMTLVEEFVKNKTVSFSKMNIKDNGAMEDYVKYGCLKFMAIDKKIYCEENGNDLNIYYIPEEYRKMN